MCEVFCDITLYVLLARTQVIRKVYTYLCELSYFSNRIAVASILTKLCVGFEIALFLCIIECI